MKGCFERDIFWRAKSRLKGIEDFNLEHWEGDADMHPISSAWVNIKEKKY